MSDVREDRYRGPHRYAFSIVEWLRSRRPERRPAQDVRGQVSVSHTADRARQAIVRDRSMIPA